MEPETGVINDAIALASTGEGVSNDVGGPKKVQSPKSVTKVPATSSPKQAGASTSAQPAVATTGGK